MHFSNEFGMLHIYESFIAFTLHTFQYSISAIIASGFDFSNAHINISLQGLGDRKLGQGSCHLDLRNSDKANRIRIIKR